MMSRRDALAALGGMVAMPSAPMAKTADAALPLVHVGVIPIFAVAPHYAADKFGYFAAEGIATTTQPVQGGAVGIPGLVSGSFLMCYGIFRIIGETFREPDVQIGFLWSGVTMGMVLSVPMVLIGAGAIVWALRRPSAAVEPSA